LNLLVDNNGEKYVGIYTRNNCSLQHLKRHIKRGNDVLKQRKELSNELMDNCNIWSAELLSTFDKAVKSWSKQGEGKEIAMNEIMKLEEDFLKLDYRSLESKSPILLFLSEDERFKEFASSCADFYKSALSVKRMAYDGIRDTKGKYLDINNNGIKTTVSSWKKEVENMLRKVNKEYLEIKTITPS
jgi:hypothetical protein